MTQSLIDQRPRSELIAELYDRHAAGLFAYCHDQLGDTTSAADALMAVLDGVPAVEPPRGALYASARREIYRRDVAYAFPSVDATTDPATALVERVVREVRPHQREVLLLSAVCGLDPVELAWVLDVAADTAEQLMISAHQRFTHSLATAVTAARSAAQLPPALAGVYGALAIAPAAQALARLPWKSPPGTLRARVLSAIPEVASPAVAAPRSGMKRLWPGAPKSAEPLADSDSPAGGETSLAGDLKPPRSGRRSRHEATTAPIPKVRQARQVRADAKDGSPEQASPFSRALSAGQWPTLQRTFGGNRPSAGEPVTGQPATEQPEATTTSSLPPFWGDAEQSHRTTAAEPAAGPAPEPVGEATRQTDRPGRNKRTGPDKQADRADRTESDEGTAQRPGRLVAVTKLFAVARTALTRKAADSEPFVPSAPAGPSGAATPAPAAPAHISPAATAPAATTPAPVSPAAESTEVPPGETSVTTSAFSGLPALPSLTLESAEETTSPIPVVPAFGAMTASGPAPAEPAAEQAAAAEPEPETASGKRTSASGPRRHNRLKPFRTRERNYDWLWEVAGFILCVGIAMLVFFALPSIITP